MKATYTPGPWKATEGYRPCIYNSKDALIAQCKGEDDWANANARLIAAAPALLEALKAMHDAGVYHFKESGWPSQFHAGALTKARAAIAQALGE